MILWELCYTIKTTVKNFFQSLFSSVLDWDWDWGLFWIGEIENLPPKNFMCSIGHSSLQHLMFRCCLSNPHVRIEKLSLHLRKRAKYVFVIIHSAFMRTKNLGEKWAFLAITQDAFENIGLFLQMMPEDGSFQLPFCMNKPLCFRSNGDSKITFEEFLALFFPSSPLTLS